MVTSVALSGDGRLLATGGEDGTAKIWDARSGRLLATLAGHTGVVWCVAVSGDGRLVASGGFDGMVRLWEAPSGRLLATLQGHSGMIFGVALSRDGQLVASGSVDGTVKLWEAQHGQMLATLQGYTGMVTSVALSWDGGLLVSGGEDGTVRVCEASRGGGLRVLRAERRYERLDITGLTGVTEAQRAALLALGARDGETVANAPAPAMVSVPPPEPEPSPLAPDSPPSNLRVAPTTFVGRLTDLTALTQALDPAARVGTRLLTLSGMAGSGKTRLALQVAEAVRDAYRDGVRLVELAPLPASRAPDPTGVAAATLSALGLQEQPGAAPVDTLLAYLQPRRLLLVLDNCEHLVAACAELAARLLAACAELQILATSQLALGGAAEVAWPVAPLALPAPLGGAPIEADLALLGQSDAVRLFVARAQVVRPSFALSTANAAVVGAICRRLDGLPLAIELAAARLNVLPLEEILARLDDRFRLLRRRGRATDERHQTLQATLDWSYRLLAPAAQTLLRRLAAFVGGWDLAAAEAVCSGETVATDAVIELLDELLDRSLVCIHDVEGVPRYGLLETVRQYGAQQLERAGEMAMLRDRHLAWCVALVEQAAPALLGPAQGAWLARLDCEHDNLRAALQWALDRRLSTLGLRVAGGLWMFWLRRRHQREGRHWLAALLALAADDDDPASKAVQASALDGAAWLAEDAQDFAQASAHFAQSGARRRALGQDEHPTALLINEAMEARAGGDYTRATALLEQSLAHHRAQGNREGIIVGGLGLSLSRLALVLAEQGAYARATTLYEECLALVHTLGDREGMGIVLLGLGDVARDQGDTARVRAYCEECLTVFRELGHQWAIGFSLNNLALAAYLEGDLALAARHAEESVALFRGLQAGPSLCEVLVTLGRVREAQGAATAAHAHLSEALGLAWARGPRFVVAAALEALGVLALRQGHGQDGVHLLGAAAALREAMGAPIRPADRRAVEEALAAARTALGSVTYEDAWTIGQSLSVEQLIARVVTGSENDLAKADLGGKAEQMDHIATEVPAPHLPY
jgi:non-specific serine/threonine protein kinase